MVHNKPMTIDVEDLELDLNNQPGEEEIQPLTVVAEPGGLLDRQRDELESSQEKVNRVVGKFKKLHNEGVAEILDKYKLAGLPPEMWLYHVYETEGKMGHVDNVEKLMELYGLMVCVGCEGRYNGDLSQEAIEKQITEDDVLGLFGEAREFVEGREDIKVLLANPARLRQLVMMSTRMAAAGHDLGNAIEGLRFNEKGEIEIIPLEEMRFEGAEDKAADMYGQMIDKHAGELELSAEERKFVSEWGKKLIIDTKFNPDEIKSGIDLMDQIGAILNRKGLAGVIALINERRVDRDTDFSPAGFLGGFITWRMATWAKNPDRNMASRFFTKIEEFAESNSDLVAKQLGASTEEIQSVEDWAEFVTYRIFAQQEVAKKVWSESFEKGENVLFSESLGSEVNGEFVVDPWIGEHLPGIEEFYNQNFWKADFVEQMKEYLASVPDRVGERDGVGGGAVGE